MGEITTYFLCPTGVESEKLKNFMFIYKWTAWALIHTFITSNSGSHNSTAANPEL